MIKFKYFASNQIRRWWEFSRFLKPSYKNWGKKIISRIISLNLYWKFFSFVYILQDWGIDVSSFLYLQFSVIVLNGICYLFHMILFFFLLYFFSSVWGTFHLFTIWNSKEDHRFVRATICNITPKKTFSLKLNHLYENNSMNVKRKKSENASNKISKRIKTKKQFNF